MWSHISREWIEISKKENGVYNYDQLHVERSKNGELGFTNNKVLLSHFEPPKFNIALAIHVYDNAVALGPRDCCERNFNPSAVPQSNLRRRASSHWALSHISRLFMFCYIFFSSRDLRGPWADLREILPHVWKHVQFINAAPKLWGSAREKTC